MKIKECKIRPAVICEGKVCVTEVAKLLEKNKERHLVVVENDKPLGVVSMTDICNRGVAKALDLRKTKAKDIMSSPVITYDINDSVEKAYVDMIKENVFFCVIVSRGKVKGFLDLREVMNKLTCSVNNKK